MMCDVPRSKLIYLSAADAVDNVRAMEMLCRRYQFAALYRLRRMPTYASGLQTKWIDESNKQFVDNCDAVLVVSSSETDSDVSYAKASGKLIVYGETNTAGGLAEALARLNVLLSQPDAESRSLRAAA